MGEASIAVVSLVLLFALMGIHPPEFRALHFVNESATQPLFLERKGAKRGEIGVIQGISATNPVFPA